jgi:hypothetical protein
MGIAGTLRVVEPAFRASAAIGLLVAATAAGAAGRETNGWRLRATASAIAYRAANPNKPWNSEIGRLDPRAFRDRAAEVAREIAADLTDPTLEPSQLNPTFDSLKKLGPLAAGISDVLVSVLHSRDNDAHA